MRLYIMIHVAINKGYNRGHIGPKYDNENI